MIMNDYGAIVIITPVITTITPMKTIKPPKTGEKKRETTHKKKNAALTILVNAVADFSADCFADN